ncbi:molybdenum cofactor guanylyltransferase [Gordonia sinesedis]
MGRDKAAMDWDGQPMLAAIVETLGRRCEPVLVVAPTSSPAYQSLYGTGGPHAEWITDEQPGQGPLSGLAAGLAAAGTAGADVAFVCATDMPLITTDLIDELLRGLPDSADAVVAHDAQRDHPMAAVYRTGIAPTIAALAASGERRMTAALDAVTTHRISVSDPDWLTNVNAPEDVHRLRASSGA